MVVARVYLIILIPVKIGLVVVVLILGMNMVGHMDVKKNIAYSTSIHLVVMVMLSCGGFYSVVIIYIILHGIVKRQLFQSSGYEIHGVGSQDIRKFGMGGTCMMIVMAMFVLSALVRMVIVGSKEVVVLGLVSLIIVCMVIVSMLYTVAYLNKCSIIGKVGQAERCYLLVMMLMSMMVVDVNLEVWLSL